MPLVVQASTLTLTKIGSVNTQNVRYLHWWYTGTQPTFAGKADPSVAVIIRTESDAHSTTADSNGDWSYTPANPLSAGDHQMKIEASDQTYAFTLTIGSDVPESIKSNPNQLPVTGGMISTFGLSGIGMGIVAFGYYLRKQNKE